MAEKTIKTIEIDGKTLNTKDVFKTMVKTKKECYDMASLLVPLWNECDLHHENLSIEASDASGIPVVTTVYDLLNEMVGHYNAFAKQECYNRLKAIGDKAEIMKQACKELTYTGIRLTKQQQGETVKIPVTSIAECEKDIDLLQLSKWCGGIGADPSWVLKLQTLNILLGIKKGRAVGDEKWSQANLRKTDTSDLMNQIANSLDELEKSKSKSKKSIDPISNTQVLKKLNELVAAMIGDEYKAIEKDMRYLMECYCAVGRNHKTLVFPKPSTFVRRVIDVCNECMTHTGYNTQALFIKNK